MNKGTALLVLLLIFNCATSHKAIKEGAGTSATEYNLTVLKLNLAQNPEDSEAHFKLAKAFAEYDSVDKAIAHFDSALIYDPGNLSAAIEKGSLLIQEQRLLDGYNEYMNVLKSTNGRDFTREIAHRIGQPYPIHQLTDGDYNNAFGYYSSGGNRIVFQSDRNGNWDLYMMNEDATDEIRLTETTANEEMPVFSSDGKLIAYTSTRDDTLNDDRIQMQRNIYYTDPDEKNEQLLVANAEDDWYPAFTNNNEELIYTSEVDDPRDVDFQDKLSDIYLKNLKTGIEQRLTQNEADDGSPVVARNGKWIVFSSNRTGNYQIYRMDKEGKKVEQLTFLKGNCGAPHLSHDGKKIVFFAEVSGNYDIYMMTIDGKKLARLTSNVAQDAYPCFSPDRSRIIFHSNRNDKFQIFWIDLRNPYSPTEIMEKLEKRIAAFR